MQLKTFLELAAGDKFRHSLYYEAIFQYYVCANTAIKDPGLPPFFTQDFIETIKEAKESNSVEGWTSKIWYTYLLDKNVLMSQNMDNDGRPICESKKVRGEVELVELDWDTIWERARLPGLSNSARTFLLKFLHNILTTQERLNKITRNTPSPNCTTCQVPDHAWHHVFTSCQDTQEEMSFAKDLVATVDPTVTLERMVFLQFEAFDQDSLLTAVWITAETMEYTWSRRKNKLVINIPLLKSTLYNRALCMKKSKKYYSVGEKLLLLLE